MAGLKRFHDQNGWQLSESLAIPYNARELILADDTMPSPSATLLRVLYDIAAKLDEDSLETEVLNITDVDVSELLTVSLWYGCHITLIHHILKSSGT